jgi:tRNA pseudouridine55 synthase
LQLERERVTQIPPLYSAIKVDGRAGYKRARAGETLELPPRGVTVHHLQLDALQPPHLQLRLKVSKGYYVRSLARDVGQSLGLPAHLSDLRRTASGAFTLGHATALDALTSASLIPTTEAAQLVMPVARLKDSGMKRARFGQALESGDFEEPPKPGLAAWLGTDGALVAVGLYEDDKGAVRRGFNI